jgi:hypothetical protein
MVLSGVMNDARRAEIFVRFALLGDLESLRPHQLHAVRDALHTATWAHEDHYGVVVGRSMDVTPRRLTAKDLTRLQRRVLMVVEDALADREPSTARIMEHDRLREGRLNWSKLAEGRVFLWWGDRFSDVTVAVARMLLHSRSGSRVRRCDDCGAIFVRIRRQRYCSPSCTGRATQRAWRERQRIKKNRRTPP